MEMPEKDLQDMGKVVLAGMKIMFDEETFKIFEKGLTNEKLPIPQRLATEAAGLMKMLYEKSGGKIPIQIIGPAGELLMLEMGKFMKESGLGSPTGDDMREAKVILIKILQSMYDKQPAAQQPQQPQQPASQPQAPAEQMPPQEPQGPGLLTQGVM